MRPSLSSVAISSILLAACSGSPVHGYPFDSRRLQVSDCDTITVSGADPFVDGVFNATGRFSNDRPVFRPLGSRSDKVILYAEADILDGSSTAPSTFDDSTQNYGIENDTDGTGNNMWSLTGEGSSGGSTVIFSVSVYDEALHPADITSDEWLLEQENDCTTQTCMVEFNETISIVCGGNTSSTTTSSSSSQSFLTSMETQSPTPATASPTAMTAVPTASPTSDTMKVTAAPTGTATSPPTVATLVPTASPAPTDTAIGSSTVPPTSAEDAAAAGDNSGDVNGVGRNQKSGVAFMMWVIVSSAFVWGGSRMA